MITQNAKAAILCCSNMRAATMLIDDIHFRERDSFIGEHDIRMEQIDNHFGRYKNVVAVALGIMLLLSVLNSSTFIN
jgi:hypothetical protein